MSNSSKEIIIKKEVLEIIRELLELNVLNIKYWYKNQEISNEHMTIDKTIENIDKVWFIGAVYPDFYDMVLFGVPNWYYYSLKELGMTETTDWKTFVSKNIGDIKKWIEENRPKE